MILCHAGATNFLLPEKGAAYGSELERAAAAHKVVCSVSPRAGSALIFKHQV